MKEFWNTIRLASYVLLLPMVATAVVSGHQWMNQQDINPITVSNISESANTSMAIIRSHTVKLDENGYLNGRLWTMDSKTSQSVGTGGLALAFVQNGKTVSRGTTDLNGVFRIPDLNPGAYSFVAQGDEGLSIYGLQIVSSDDTSVEARSGIESMTISHGIPTIRNIIEKEMKSFSGSSPAITSELVPVVNSNQVYLDEENNLRGQVFAIDQYASLENCKITLMQNGKVVHETTSHGDGSYEFDGVEPGYYDFFSYGEHGVAAFRFEALQSPSTLTLVSFTTENGNKNLVQDMLQVPMGNLQDVQQVFQRTLLPQGQDQPPTTVFNSVPDNGFVVNGNNNFGPRRIGGGNGLGGGGGSLLGLAGLAGFAGLAGDGGPPAPTSPAN